MDDSRINFWSLRWRSHWSKCEYNNQDENSSPKNPNNIQIINLHLQNSDTKLLLLQTVDLIILLKYQNVCLYFFPHDSLVFCSNSWSCWEMRLHNNVISQVINCSTFWNWLSERGGSRHGFIKLKNVQIRILKWQQDKTNSKWVIINVFMKW